MIHIQRKTSLSKDWTSKLEAWIKGQTYGCFDKTEEADRNLDKTNEENKQEAVAIFVSCTAWKVRSKQITLL
jgi:hypothetical protein